MRKSTKTEKVFNKNNEFVGYKLHGDYLAEHEHGISGMKKALSKESFWKSLFLKSNTAIRIVPSNDGYYLDILPKNEHTFLDTAFLDKKTNKESAWSKNSLVIFEKKEKYLHLLQEAEKNNDIEIGFINTSRPATLFIGVKSKMD